MYIVRLRLEPWDISASSPRDQPLTPPVTHPKDGALLYICPGVSFRCLCGVRPAHMRRLRRASHSHEACAEFMQRGARLTRRDDSLEPLYSLREMTI